MPSIAENTAMHTNYNEQQLQALLSKVRIFNTHIGEYQHHTRTATSEYVIHLSNGTLSFTDEEVEADQQRTLTPEILTTISDRFSRLNTAEPHEISDFFTYEPVPDNSEKSGLRAWIILVFIVFLIIIGGILIAQFLNRNIAANYGSLPTDSIAIGYPSGKTDPQTESQLLTDFKGREGDNPVKHLSINWETRENVMAQRIFEGSIYNEAEAAGFMNIQVRISGYSKNNYLVDERDFILTEFVDAGGAHSFKWRSEEWDPDVAHFEMQIVKAEWY